MLYNDFYYIYFYYTVFIPICWPLIFSIVPCLGASYYLDIKDIRVNMFFIISGPYLAYKKKFPMKNNREKSILWFTLKA